MTTHPYIVGLTGGIGSGKSTVADAFRALGVQVVDADQASREVVKPGTKALKSIDKHFSKIKSRYSAGRWSTQPSIAERDNI